MKSLCFLLLSIVMITTAQVSGQEVSPQQYFAYRSFHKEAEMTKKFADMGVRVRCFYAANTINSLKQPYCEYPLIWKGIKDYNWSAYDSQVTDLLAAHPEEKLLCMIDLNTPAWAVKKFGYDSFHRITPAASDPEWIKITTEWMIDFLKYSEQKYGDKISAYIIAGGGTSEWYEYFGGERFNPKNRAWVEWQKKHGYQFSEVTPLKSSLSKAAFENTLYDPKTEKEKIAYWQFHNEIIVDAILHFAHVAKKLYPQKEFGAFFGYFLVTDTKIVSFGHLDYERLYADPAISFYISPGTYADRAMGQGSGPQLVQGDIVRYKRRYMHEIDHRTSAKKEWLNAWKNRDEDIAGMKRELAYAIINNSSLWIFDMWGGRFVEEELRNTVKKGLDIYNRFLKEEEPSTAEVLLVVDPQSAYYLNETVKNISSMTDALRNRLNRTGTPYDVYAFNDLSQIDMSRYKVVLFPGTYLITPEREEVLKKHVCNGKRTVIWFYAPGVIDGESFDISRVKKFTGVDYKAKGLERINRGDWTSIYSHDCPADLSKSLHQIFKEAGVHCYLEDLVPVYANTKLLMVHTGQGGTKKIALPKTYSKVTELYTGRVVAENVREFSYEFNNPDTALFELAE